MVYIFYMLKPFIHRTSAGSDGEKIVEMISQKLSRISHNLFFQAEGDVITVVSKQTAIPMDDYFTKRGKRQEIKELIRML
jgi:hypothetical protein